MHFQIHSNNFEGKALLSFFFFWMILPFLPDISSSEFQCFTSYKSAVIRSRWSSLPLYLWMILWRFPNPQTLATALPPGSIPLPPALDVTYWDISLSVLQRNHSLPTLLALYFWEFSLQNNVRQIVMGIKINGVEWYVILNRNKDAVQTVGKLHLKILFQTYLVWHILFIQLYAVICVYYNT